MSVGIFIAGGVEPSQKEIVKAITCTIGEVYDNVLVFTTNKGSKLKYLTNNNIKLINLHEFVDAKTWVDKYNIALKVLEKYKVDRMFITKQVILQTYNYKDDSVLVNYITKWQNEPEFSMKFQMLKMIYERICFITAIAKKCKTIELVIDPQQIDVSKHIKFIHGYKRLYILNKPEYKLEYGKFYEPYYFPYYGIEQMVKDVEFCFACTAITDDRKYIAKYADREDIWDKEWLIKIVTNNKSGKKLSQTDYYNWLYRSKFTMIIPSYDKTTFSIIRFIEALKFGCVPFVHRKCNLNDLLYTFPSLYDIITKKLIVNSVSEIKNKIVESNYGLLLMEILRAAEKDRIYDTELSKTKFEKIWREM